MEVCTVGTSNEVGFKDHIVKDKSRNGDEIRQKLIIDAL